MKIPSALLSPHWFVIARGRIPYETVVEETVDLRMQVYFKAAQLIIIDRWHG